MTSFEERLAAIANLRIGHPPEAPVDVVRPFYPEQIEGMFSVAAFGGGDTGRVVVLLVEGDDVAPHRGLDEAARRLRALGVLGRGQWAIENLRPLLDAVGGLTPGYGGFETEHATELPDGGGLELALTGPEEWVRFAASGASGPPPPTTTAAPGGGLAPPKPQGLARSTVDAGYRLRWTYHAAGEIPLGEVEGDPDDSPTAEDDPPNDPLVVEATIAAARRARSSPLAVPAAPVRRGRAPGTCIVPLLGIGDVEVTVPGG